ncbi:hypothetical protein B0H63DRAFT_545370 [Podospora didyma]|uniref:BTB domain-containing protein n=1 Tax=Podospora didyma TaxID=330526 RepID=A0AAE0TVK2_9PEZI|nr:hypothetical protein B0H63DRAFT_545370 [Podospora didyma]
MDNPSPGDPAASAIVADVTALPPKMIELTMEGNVVLAISNHNETETREFLVSSKILALASKYFANLFSLKFAEGRRLAFGGEQARIELMEDYLDAMEFLLSILHSKTTDTIVSENPSYEMIASIAVQTDKYLCSDAIKPWIACWMLAHDLRNGISALWPDDRMYMLFAAYLFRPNNLGQVTTEISKQLKKPDVRVKRLEGGCRRLMKFSKIYHAEDGKHALTMSAAVTILDFMDSSHIAIVHRLQRGLAKLRRSREVHSLPRAQLKCLKCGKLYPPGSDDYSVFGICPCSRDLQRDGVCGPAYRVDHYFDELKKISMSPLWVVGAERTLEQMTTDVLKLVVPEREHECTGKEACCFKTELEHIPFDVQDIISKCVITQEDCLSDPGPALKHNGRIVFQTPAPQLDIYQGKLK